MRDRRRNTIEKFDEIFRSMSASLASLQGLLEQDSEDQEDGEEREKCDSEKSEDCEKRDENDSQRSEVKEDVDRDDSQLTDVTTVDDDADTSVKTEGENGVCGENGDDNEVEDLVGDGLEAISNDYPDISVKLELEDNVINSEDDAIENSFDCTFSDEAEHLADLDINLEEPLEETEANKENNADDQSELEGEIDENRDVEEQSILNEDGAEYTEEDITFTVDHSEETFTQNDETIPTEHCIKECLENIDVENIEDDLDKTDVEPSNAASPENVKSDDLSRGNYCSNFNLEEIDVDKENEIEFKTNSTETIWLENDGHDICCNEEEAVGNPNRRKSILSDIKNMFKKSTKTNEPQDSESVNSRLSRVQPTVYVNEQNKFKMCYKCDKCGKDFKFLTNLKDHMQSKQGCVKQNQKNKCKSSGKKKCRKGEFHFGNCD